MIIMIMIIYYHYYQNFYYDYRVLYILIHDAYHITIIHLYT